MGPRQAHEEAAITTKERAQGTFSTKQRVVAVRVTGRTDFLLGCRAITESLARGPQDGSRGSGEEESPRPAPSLPAVSLVVVTRDGCGLALRTGESGHHRSRLPRDHGKGWSG